LITDQTLRPVINQAGQWLAPWQGRMKENVTVK